MPPDDGVFCLSVSLFDLSYMVTHAVAAALLDWSVYRRLNLHSGAGPQCPRLKCSCNDAKTSFHFPLWKLIFNLGWYSIRDSILVSSTYLIAHFLSWLLTYFGCTVPVSAYQIFISPGNRNGTHFTFINVHLNAYQYTKVIYIKLLLFFKWFHFRFFFVITHATYSVLLFVLLYI